MAEIYQSIFFFFFLSVQGCKFGNEIGLQGLYNVQMKKGNSISQFYREMIIWLRQRLGVGETASVVMCKAEGQRSFTGPSQGHRFLKAIPSESVYIKKSMCPQLVVMLKCVGSIKARLIFKTMQRYQDFDVNKIKLAVTFYVLCLNIRLILSVFIIPSKLC